jgi:hypothetical protein
MIKNFDKGDDPTNFQPVSNPPQQAWLGKKIPEPEEQ